MKHLVIIKWLLFIGILFAVGATVAYGYDIKLVLTSFTAIIAFVKAEYDERKAYGETIKAGAKSTVVFRAKTVKKPQKNDDSWDHNLYRDLCDLLSSRNQITTFAALDFSRTFNQNSIKPVVDLAFHWGTVQRNFRDPQLQAAKEKLHAAASDFERFTRNKLRVMGKSAKGSNVLSIPPNIQSDLVLFEMTARQKGVFLAHEEFMLLALPKFS